MAKLVLNVLDHYGPLTANRSYQAKALITIVDFESLEVQLAQVGLHRVPAGVKLIGSTMFGGLAEIDLDDVPHHLYWVPVTTFYHLIFEWRSPEMVVDPTSEQDAYPFAAIAMAGLNATVGEMAVVIAGLHGNPSIWKP